MSLDIPNSVSPSCSDAICSQDEGRTMPRSASCASARSRSARTRSSVSGRLPRRLTRAVSLSPRSFGVAAPAPPAEPAAPARSTRWSVFTPVSLRAKAGGLFLRGVPSPSLRRKVTSSRLESRSTYSRSSSIAGCRPSIRTRCWYSAWTNSSPRSGRSDATRAMSADMMRGVGMPHLTVGSRSRPYEWRGTGAQSPVSCDGRAAPNILRGADATQCIRSCQRIRVTIRRAGCR
jgi:hypothetical protein